MSNDNGKLVKKLGLAEYLADRFAIVGDIKDCARKVSEAGSWSKTLLDERSFPNKEHFMQEWNEKSLKQLIRIHFRNCS